MAALTAIGVERTQALARLLRSAVARVPLPASRRLRLGGLAAVAVLVAVAVVLVVGGRENPAQPAAAPATRPATAAVALADIANHDGGYALSYPVGWQASTSASRTEILSPARDVSVSVGLGARGKLKATTDRYVALLRDGYTDVTVNARQRDRVAGRPALAVAGEATNPEGARLRWMAVGVERKGRDLLVAIFSDAAGDPAEVLPPTQQIVSSLQLLD